MCGISEDMNEERAGVFFSIYTELDSEFKRYGFDKDKDRIIFDHETGYQGIGICTYFRISEKINLTHGNGSERIDFYVGAFLRTLCIQYKIESINVILYRDTEINGERTTTSFNSQKYNITNGPLPTKNEILNYHIGTIQDERLANAKALLEKLQPVTTTQEKRSRLRR